MKHAAETSLLAQAAVNDRPPNKTACGCLADRMERATYFALSSAGVGLHFAFYFLSRGGVLRPYRLGRRACPHCARPLRAQKRGVV